MPIFTPLDGSQVRQLIDTEQLYLAFRAAETERAQRFSGSMAWKTVKGGEYLYRKTGDKWKSLGRRNEATEQSYARFHQGRSAIRERIDALDGQIRRIAPINRAMRLGRVPWTVGRLLRKLESRGLLGGALSVVGTHALFAYERMAGGHFHSSQVATADIDLLYNARDRLDLAAPQLREEGLQGLLREVDRSFQPIVEGGYRAVNKDGYLVDLITPLASQPSFDSRAKRIGGSASDMTAAEIEGLAWLQNSPQIVQIVIDERGFPVTLHVPDPRAFALHKLWVSKRPDRDRLKARRDREQAYAVAGLLERHLPHLRFDDPALSALPMTLRDRASDLLSNASSFKEKDLEDW